jgi:hypothetical protein
MMKSLAAVPRLMPQVLSRRSVAVALPPAEAPLFQEQGVLVTSERVVTRGRSRPLADVLGVESVRHSPRLTPLVALLALAVSVGLPVLSAVSVAPTAARGYYEAALVALALTVFGTVARLVLAEDSYRVVLRTSEGPWCVFSSSESGTSTRLAELVQDAVRTARKRR